MAGDERHGRESDRAAGTGNGSVTDLEQPLGDRRADSFCQHAGALEIGMFAKHDKLVAAPAHNGVDGTEHPPQDVCDLDQNGVAAFVTVLVVDGLQVIEVNDHEDRKSTRLNSSHQIISYAVFCLKKKKKK